MQILSIVLAALAFRLSACVGSDPSANATKPNIIFILSDDQDARMNSLDYMPKVKKYLSDEGTLFTKHYAHVALCCPSRVTLWTGQHAVS
jgi:N-acetylglucosamine-6-sulfatase